MGSEGSQLLFGIETEYGFTVFDPAGDPVDRGRASARLLGSVVRRRTHLPSGQRLDAFLANGARCYVDCGSHPEYATPECNDPLEAVACVRAGDRILWAAAQEVAETLGSGSEVMLYRGNVDYANGVTWGCHESYLCRTAPRELAPALVPHLVSRLVYTGAGGLEKCPGGARFVLSPRVGFIRHEYFRHSPDSTRGIFHLRNEPLGGPALHRLHVVCGESVSSELADYLRVGTTALLASLIDSGGLDVQAVRVLDPLKAIHRFSRDPTCTERVAVSGGRYLTAVQIQRVLLEQVEPHLEDGALPTWANQVCARWGAILDRLEADPSSLARALDWPLKRMLFEEHLAGRDLDWKHLTSLPLAGPVSTDVLDELFEIDTRFAQLGPRGIFSGLDGAGVLSHRILDDERVERLVDSPPPGGRAEERGLRIRRYAGRPTRYQSGWTGIRDLARSRTLVMGDPFGQQPARWTKSLDG